MFANIVELVPPYLREGTGRDGLLWSHHPAVIIRAVCFEFADTHVHGLSTLLWIVMRRLSACVKKSPTRVAHWVRLILHWLLIVYFALTPQVPLITDSVKELSMVG